MTQKIPELEDLLRGINDPSASLEMSGLTSPSKKEAEIQDGSAIYGPAVTSAPEARDETWWNRFMAHLEEYDGKPGRTGRNVCMLDQDIADSLGECYFHRKCRSDIVNAIVRAFLEQCLPRLSPYRRENRSLFINLKKHDYGKK